MSLNYNLLTLMFWREAFGHCRKFEGGGAGVNACPHGLWHLFVHVKMGFSSYMRGQNSCQNGHILSDVSASTMGICFLLLGNSKMD